MVCGKHDKQKLKGKYLTVRAVTLLCAWMGFVRPTIQQNYH